jgi:hypothetical protein
VWVIHVAWGDCVAVLREGIGGIRFCVNFIADCACEIVEGER